MSVNNNDLIAKIDNLIKQSRNIRQKYSQKGGNFGKYVDLDTPVNAQKGGNSKYVDLDTPVNAQKGGNSKYVDLDTPVNGQHGQRGGMFSKYVDLDTPTNTYAHSQKGGNFDKYVDLDTPVNTQQGGMFGKYVDLDTPTNAYSQKGGKSGGTISILDKIDFDLLLDDRLVQNADQAMSNMFGGGCGDDKGCGSCGSYSGGCGCYDKPRPQSSQIQAEQVQSAGSHVHSNSCGCGPMTPLFPGANPDESLDYVDQNNASIDAALRDIDKFLGGF